MPEDTEIDEVRQEVHRDDDRHAKDQGAREVALRLDDLFGNEVGLLPAAVGEKDWDECRTQTGGRTAGRPDGRKRRRSEYESRGYERCESRQLQDCEDVLRDCGRPDTDVVDGRKTDDRSHGQRH